MLKTLFRLSAVMALVLCCAWLVWGYSEARLIVPDGDIVFSHALHAEFECISCHPAILTSTMAEEKNLPTMDECGLCHDVESDETCKLCHRNPLEPEALINPDRPIVFNHQLHAAQQTACGLCHGDVTAGETLTTEANMPAMSVCFSCHDGTRVDNACELCHGDRITLDNIHPAGWRHRHGEQAENNTGRCETCHRREQQCLECHQGDNITGKVHNLNYRYNHGLDAGSKEIDCSGCHEREAFCNDCHQANNRIPLRHSTLGWLSEHGEAARDDVENCASCHESADPTCARPGCHNDFDGMRGTNPMFHAADPGSFDSHGPWHGDDGYFCYQCHISTGTPGAGFCGYCHD